MIIKVTTQFDKSGYEQTFVDEYKGRKWERLFSTGGICAAYEYDNPRYRLACFGARNNSIQKNGKPASLLYCDY